LSEWLQNPNDREAWNELVRESPTKVRKETKHHPASTEVASLGLGESCLISSGFSAIGYLGVFWTTIVDKA
jgi:hypothetical protein